MNVLRAMDQLLKRPEESDALSPFALLLGAVVCYALYGVAAGFFQGGSSIGLAVLKTPLIIIGSLLLCLPSLYVFTALAGADLTPRSFTAAVAGFSGVAGLLLLALMPVVWLFSVSTISLAFMVWMHIAVWVITLVFAQRFIARTAPSARSVIGIWLALLFFVSLQMTTYVRPVLWRSADESLFASGKLSFFSHLEEVTRWKAPAPALPVTEEDTPPRSGK
jgi:hypothetical protein